MQLASIIPFLGLLALSSTAHAQDVADTAPAQPPEVTSPDAEALPPPAGDTQAQPPAQMQNQPENVETSTGLMPQQQSTQMLASQLMGADVLDANNEQVGDIADLIIDENNQVVGIVVEVGGFLGMGAHSVGVAFSELAPSSDPSGYSIALTNEELRNAPAFKTFAEIEAESEAERLRLEQEQQMQQQQQPIAPQPPQ